MDDHGPGPGPETETESLPPTSAVGSVDRAETRRLYAVIGVLVAVIVVLLVRPWGDGVAVPRGPDGPAVPASIRPPGATSPPAAEAPLEATCGSPSGWRAATLQEWAGRSTPIRSWIAITPVPATGPTDPGIPFAPIATGRVQAIGYCAPLVGDDVPPPASTAGLWAIRGAAGLPLELAPLEPATPDPLGGLWLPPPGLAAPPSPGPSDGPEGSPALSTGTVPDASPAPGAQRSWPPGRYVIRLSTPDGTYDRWLGIEIEDLSLILPAPSPAPSGSTPAPSGSPRASPAAGDPGGSPSP